MRNASATPSSSLTRQLSSGQCLVSCPASPSCVAWHEQMMDVHVKLSSCGALPVLLMARPARAVFLLSQQQKCLPCCSWDARGTIQVRSPTAALLQQGAQPSRPTGIDLKSLAEPAGPHWQHEHGTAASSASRHAKAQSQGPGCRPATLMAAKAGPAAAPSGIRSSQAVLDNSAAHPGWPQLAGQRTTPVELAMHWLMCRCHSCHWQPASLLSSQRQV